MSLQDTLWRIEWPRDWPVLLVGLFVACGVAIPEMMSASHGLLLIAALITIRWPRRRLHRDEKGLAVMLVAYWAYGLVSYFLGDRTELGFSVLGRDVRLLLAIPVIFLVARLRWNVAMASWAMALAGILCGLAAGLEYLLNGMGTYRVSGPTVSIVFGNTCAAIAAANLGLVIGAAGKQRWFHVLAMVLASGAILLSGTRGALLALLVASLALVIVLPRIYSLRARVLVAAIGLAVIMVTLVMNPGSIRKDALFAEFRSSSALLFDSRSGHEMAGYEWSSSATQEFVSDSDGPVSIVEGDEEAAPRYFFRIEAGSHRRYVRLPYRNEVSETPLVMMVRGEVSLISPEGVRKKIKASEWQETVIHLESQKRYGRFQLLLQPGQRFDFLPRVDHPREWRFTAFASSVGTRIVMWDYVANHPAFATLTGAGLGRFPIVAQEGWHEGQLPYFAIQYDHVHNDYLNVLFERGLAGLLLLLGLFLAPFIAFIRALRRPDARPLALGGIAFVISLAVSGITETMMIHSYSISFFGVMLAVLVSTIHNTPITVFQKSDDKRQGFHE